MSEILLIGWCREQHGSTTGSQEARLANRRITGCTTELADARLGWPTRCVISRSGSLVLGYR